MRVDKPNVMCYKCAQAGDEEIATHLCTQCQTNFCDFHTKKHSAQNSQHKFRSLLDENSGSSNNIQLSMCPHHHIPINIYCRTCEALICATCGFSKQHKGHVCEVIDEIAEQERIWLRKNITQLEKEISEWDEEHHCQDNILRKELKEVENRETELKLQVKTYCEDVKRMIDNRERELCTKISRVCKEGTDTIQTIIGFKEMRKDMKETLDKIDTLGVFELMEAKITKFIQVQRDFNKLKNDFSGNVELIHHVTLDGIKENVSEMEKIISEMGKIMKSTTPVTVKFSNLGAEGCTGPITVGNYYHDQPALLNNVSLLNGIQQWVVPCDGEFKITAAGAAGGSNSYNTAIRAGFGAIVSGVFKLTRGTTLSILVGQRGCNVKGNTAGGAAGGGGGTFVVLTNNNSPLLIAAGGNGCNWASWNTNGPCGRRPNPNEHHRVDEQAKGERGGGGGGFKLAGMKGHDTEGGQSFLQGGKGGKSSSNSSYGADGGFGGGGASLHEGGGGGGYIGGSVVPSNQYTSNFPSYGAISFNSGSLQQSHEDTNDGHGYVIISNEQ